MKVAMQSQPSNGPNTLSHDAELYLKLVGPTVSLVNRTREIGVWLPRFGHLRTRSLPNHTNALNAQLREWRAELAASTVNHRRDSLANLVKVLYGKRAWAEMADLQRFRPDPPKPRWVDREHVEDVLGQLQKGTKTAARMWLLHWTGMRASQLERLTIDDFRFDEDVPYVAIPRGKKGKLSIVPLAQEGLAAAHAFIDIDAFGTWSRGSANRMLETAAERANRKPFTLHQIRHSFAAALRRSGTDLADISDMMGHTNPEVTQIYAPTDLEKLERSIQRLRNPDDRTHPTHPKRGGNGKPKLQLVR